MRVVMLSSHVKLNDKIVDGIKSKFNDENDDVRNCAAISFGICSK